jgi:hypothetical protein
VLTHSRNFQSEVSRQAAEAAEEIVRANVDKAKAGSLAHSKWLYGLLERQGKAELLTPARLQTSLADLLLQELGGTR